MNLPPLYQQIKEKIMQMASAGADGEEGLPSVGELSSRFAVNPHLVEQACRELREEGFLVLGEDGRTHADDSGYAMTCCKRELMQQFDQIVRKLKVLSVQPEELHQRLNVLTKGEKDFD